MFKKVFLNFNLRHAAAFLLIFLFFVVAQNPALAANKENEGLNVLIHGDPAVFEPYLLGREIRRISKQYGENVITIEAHSAAQFVQGLKKVSDLGLPIRSLTFRGIHGANYEQIPYFEVVEVGADDFETVGIDDLARAGIKLKTNDQTVVFFDSCSMIDGTNKETIKKSFQEFEKIGINHGRFYMNKTTGSNAIQNVLTVPFYAQTGDWMHRMRQFALQIGWPVTLTIYYYMDYFKSNQGFLRDKRGRHDRYVSMHASAALRLR